MNPGGRGESAAAHACLPLPNRRPASADFFAAYADADFAMRLRFLVPGKTGSASGIATSLVLLFVAAFLAFAASPAHAVITYVASASNPADNGSLGTTPVAVAPPGGMVAGDLVILVANTTVNTVTMSMSVTGGQAWTAQTNINTTGSQRMFWARYNGTWTASPSVAFSDSSNTTVVMHVFRPTLSSNPWAIDVAQTSSAATPGTNNDVTIGGITTNTDGALVLATWTSIDDNTWALQTTGWTNAGGANYRNRSSSDASQSSAYLVKTTAGATGAVVNRQTGLGPDNGNISILAFKEIPPLFPSVVSINRASFDPTSGNTAVTWVVTFDRSVTGVDISDFSLVQAGGAAGAAITSVTGSGAIWTVTANTGTGTSGTVQLKLVDDDSIKSGTIPLGGAGAGNGNFTGQAYTILPSPCTGAADIVFCDNFERSNPGLVGNGWTVTESTPANCNGTTGNARCAGIDSDIPPFNNYANPRANPTRAMFTRWSQVWVTSPTINMAGRVGGQFSFWMRRGHDDFSECPEAIGENFLVEYRASDNTWKSLAQYPSSPTAALCDGQIWTPTIELPADALHANLQLRFYQPSGSGASGSGGAPGVVGYDYWHMDDVIVREKAAPSFTGAFCDNFEGGLGRWSISSEGSPVGATIGDASLGTLTNLSPTHSLDMRWGYVTASTFKTDITGVTGNITFWVKSGSTTDRDPDLNEDLIAEYLNSSETWVNLATYLGSAAANTVYNASFPIPADAKHANFRLRFRHLNASGYDFDYWHLDDVCVGDPTQADLSITKVRNGSLVPGTNASYSITVKNNGPNTMSGSLQVTDTLPATLSYLSATGTGWSCSAGGATNRDITCNWSGSIANGANADLLTLTVSVASSATGTVSNTAVVAGSVTDGNLANNTSTDTATIYIPGYVFTDKACTTGVAIGSGANPCNLVDWSSVTAGQSVGNVFLTALNSAGIPTQLSATNPTTVNFQFAQSCFDPTTTAGVQATFSAVASALPTCAASGAVPTTWSASTALVFPAASPSVGPYTFNYADVGKVELYVRNAGATSQIGQSGAFVVKPAGFVVSGIRCTTINAANCGAGALAMATPGDNPAAASAAGVTFIRAGDPFTVTVTAVNANGVATPNFGRETAAETVKLTPQLVAPLDCDGNPANDPDCNNPALSGALGTFTNGVASGTAFSWGNVGIVKLLPSIGDGDYLGVGNVTGTATGNVGRFYPHHFDTTVSHACGSFTYSGQPFPAKITAMTTAGVPTTNYQGLFARTTTFADANGAAGVFSPLSLAAADFAAGEVNLTVTPSLKFTFTNKLTGVSALKLRVTDTDSVSSATGAEGVTSLRSGRLRLINAYGSELLPIRVEYRAEYWDGNRWLTNTSDTCSGIAAANVAGMTPSGSPTFNNGVGFIIFPSPGVAFRDIAVNLGATGGDASCNVTGFPAATSGADKSWLRGNWCGTSGYVKDPNARIRFGSPKAPYIYLRERY